MKAKPENLKRALICCCMGMLFSGMSACSTYKPVPVGTIPQAQAPQAADLYTTRGLVERMVQSENYVMHAEGAEYDRINRILGNLSQASGNKSGTWPVYLIDAGDKINASAVNGNTIIVYRGLVKKVKDDAELSTVIAHEIGHIIANHKDDESGDSKKTAVAVGGRILGYAAAFASYYGGASTSLANTAGSLAESATRIVGEGSLIKSYDRALEYEADQIGLMIMAKAGYDPKSAIAFWERAEEVFGHGNGFDFLSTHPASSKRAEELKKALPVAEQYYQQKLAKH